jgi:PKD repeat protein
LSLVGLGRTAAQTYPVVIEGVLIRDSTGSPLVDHEVFITFDTVPGFTYLNWVRTDTNGFYRDVVQVPTGVPSTAVWLRTDDCQAITLLGHVPVGLANSHVFRIDSICGWPLVWACRPRFDVTALGGNSYQFTDRSTSGDAAVALTGWLWDFGDGTTSTAQSPIHYYASPGNYPLCLSITSAAGCAVTQCDSFLVYPSSGTCQASWHVASQSGLTVNFDNTSISTSGYQTVLWEFGDGSQSAVFNPAYTYYFPGTYDVTLYILSGDSCYDTHTMPVVVNPTTCAAGHEVWRYSDPLEIAWNSRNVLPLNTYVLSTLWDFGDGSTATNNGFAGHRYAAAGIYPVCQTITTSSGCTATYCDTLVIGNGVCAAGFGWMWGGNCTYDFRDSSYAAAGVARYLWDFGDGSTSTSAQPLHQFSGSGTYAVCLTITTHDSCQNTICRDVACGSGALCMAAYSYAPDPSGNYTLLLTNESMGSGLSYLWDFGDGGTSTQAYPTHVYNGAGTYRVCLLVTGPGACASVYCDSLVVPYRLGQPFSIHVQTPPTGMSPVAEAAASLQLHPNPAGDRVTLGLQLVKPAHTHVRLLDTQGRVVQAHVLGLVPASPHTEALDLAGLPQGLYFVEVVAGDQRVVQKLVRVD